jgi:hypothetical protein
MIMEVPHPVVRVIILFFHLEKNRTTFDPRPIVITAELSAMLPNNSKSRGA